RVAFRFGYCRCGASGWRAEWSPASDSRVRGRTSARPPSSRRSTRSFPNRCRARMNVSRDSIEWLMAASNPLLEFPGLPRFDAVEPTHVTPAVDELLANARATIEAVASDTGPPAWEKIVAPLADCLDRLD